MVHDSTGAVVADQLSAETAVANPTVTDPATIESTSINDTGAATTTSPSVQNNTLQSTVSVDSNDDNYDESNAKYRCLIIDSGPIIRLSTGLQVLYDRAQSFYTVPAVLQEIRDAKAREHLESLPFTLQTRLPSKEGLQVVTNFAKKTGDYVSLSSVDLQVLALLYDLEKEGCKGDLRHVQTEPQSVINAKKAVTSQENSGSNNGEEKDESDCESEGEDVYDDDGDDDQLLEESTNSNTPNSVQICSLNLSSTAAAKDAKPKTWAALVNPKEGSSILPTITTTEASISLDKNTIKSSPNAFNGFKLPNTINEDSLGGQFSDAEEENDKFKDINISSSIDAVGVVEKSVEEDLQSDFPSLAASTQVPYEGEDEDTKQKLSLHEEIDRRKQQSLLPVSKSGKLYNSFRNYSNLMKPKPSVSETSTIRNTGNNDDNNDDDENIEKAVVKTVEQAQYTQTNSRITGGSAFAGQDGDVDDDGEGWITSSKDIFKMKSVGMLDPTKDPSKLSKSLDTTSQQGPPISQRAACATTDFAMQNIILQMRLELLSVDGMKIQKLKTWVLRCGACFKVYTNPEDTGPLSKRLFCERCGSDFMQRIAASVDAKSGRLSLHLSKRYRHNLRGTKFSLPKPGSANKYQGDLLLREDQLLMGAWLVKAKMRAARSAKNDSQSIFGKDIASNVGCHNPLMDKNDIRPGFGRQNPNAAKGRERRGKKKKSTDKACGLRRY